MLLRRAAAAFFFACFLLFAVTTGVTRLVHRTRVPLPSELNESWEPDLASVHSVDEAMRVLPSYIARQHGSREARTAAGIDQFVRERFVHGASLLGYRHNWLAAMAGWAWIDLRVPVLPDDILHHRHATCSQQAIVFMELLKRHHIRYASVLMGWPSADRYGRGHFAVAAMVDGRWLYFDPDQEAAKIAPVERVIDGSALAALYGGKPALLANMRYAAARRQIRLAHVDEYPAPRGGLFQIVTEWLSHYGWLLFGLLTLAELLMRRRSGGFGPPIAVPAE
jgi:hypothetical protein